MLLTIGSCHERSTGSQLYTFDTLQLLARQCHKRTSESHIRTSESLNRTSESLNRTSDFNRTSESLNRTSDFNRTSEVDCQARNSPSTGAVVLFVTGACPYAVPCLKVLIRV